MKRWIEIETFKESAKRSVEFWGVPEIQETENGFQISAKGVIHSGEFWTEQIKQAKGNPRQQLKICIDNLPLPAAFKKAAIATRAIVKELKKTNQDTTKAIKMLYRIEAVDSFRVPYCDRLDIPGFNIIEATPGALLWKAKIDYHKLGFLKFPLANKTDAKWFTETFGEPKEHSTMHVLFQDLWREAERQYDKSRPDYLRSM